MAELADFQLAFAGALRRRGRKGLLERQPGFAVYRNTTATALIDVLRAAYPAVAEIVGGGAFESLAIDYSRHRPPESPVLAGYGEGFADFLDAQPWREELPYLADVARIERIWTEAHLAADAQALTLTDLAAVAGEAWAGLRFAVHPAARYVRFRTPAFTIWRAHRDATGFDRLEPEWRAEHVLLTRPDGAVLDTELDPAAFLLLDELAAGRDFGEAADAVLSRHADALVVETVATLIARGAFAASPPDERT